MSKAVFCGDVKIGGGAPVSIQSMSNIDTKNVQAVVRQIDELTEAGCDIMRLAVPDMEAAECFGRIKKGVRIPLVADVHFDYRLAIEAIEQGADKVRINPGNIGGKDRVEAVARAAKKRGIPIRIGVNSGSLGKDLIEKYGGITAQALVDSAFRGAEMLEDMDFHDIVFSMKSSNPKLNFEAYRLMAKQSDYPLHIGVTEAGTPSAGKIKSAVGIGGLLLLGIGDTMRVSLTADPKEEIILAKQILESAGLKKSALNIVSCPTCGRTGVNLEMIASSVETALREIAAERESLGKPALKVAIMGCEVNGPGEAKDADLGIACGRGKGALFIKGKVVKTLPEAKLIDELIKAFINFD